MLSAQGNICYLSLCGGGKILSVFRIKLKNCRDNVLVQSILGGYSHLMWVRTENPEDPVVAVFTTRGFEDETKKILRAFKSEVDFEFVTPEEK